MNPAAVIVAGLGFGDEGKGSITDFLARNLTARRVVRYNGGAQAGHNVVLNDGRHHMFAQFGSATFVPGVETHLSRFMMVNPFSMQSEEKHLQTVGVTDALARMTIERGALITNPFQVAMNRLLESVRSRHRHGSCGMGIGETMADSLSHPEDTLRVGDLEDPMTMRSKLLLSQARKVEQARAFDHDITIGMQKELDILEDPELVDECVWRYHAFAKQVRIVDETYLPTVMRDGTTIFEGAQGLLLDQDFGFHPYTTWSAITFANALELLSGFSGKVTRLGIIRAHATRHGAGPFPSEDPSMVLAKDHNAWGAWQHGFRVGNLDFPLLRYACKALGALDEIAVTHLDLFKRFNTKFRTVCSSYEGDVLIPLPKGVSNTPKRLSDQEWNTKLVREASPVFTEVKAVADLLAGVEECLKAPVTICSYGPTAEDKRLR